MGRDHDVTGISDPREVLAAVERGERYDVVFCDLMMPYLPGPALYARVLELAPELAERFVFITGAATDPKNEAFLADVPNERVDKPFSIQNIRGIAKRFAATPLRASGAGY